MHHGFKIGILTSFVKPISMENKQLELQILSQSISQQPTNSGVCCYTCSHGWFLNQENKVAMLHKTIVTLMTLVIDLLVPLTPPRVKLPKSSKRGSRGLYEI
jgi:hypothetical protein